MNGSLCVPCTFVINLISRSNDMVTMIR